RRSERSREAFGSPAASAAKASTPRPWRAIFSPKPLSRVTTPGVCSPRSNSCGPAGASAAPSFQGFSWGPVRAEAWRRGPARAGGGGAGAGRGGGGEAWRGARRAAGGGGEGEPGGGAHPGVVRPGEPLRGEPRRGDLPADPVAAQEIPSPSIDRQTVDEPLEAR